MPKAVPPEWRAPQGRPVRRATLVPAGWRGRRTEEPLPAGYRRAARALWPDKTQDAEAVLAALQAPGVRIQPAVAVGLATLGGAVREA
jgi:hypothetical protein